MFLCSPASGTGELWIQTEQEAMRLNQKHSSLWGWLMMGAKSLLGMLGLDKAYQSLFKQVLENYMREFDPPFTATDAMVENVRAEPINMTRACILKYRALKDPIDYRFPIVITYGEKDIYGKSQQSVRSRFPKAMLVEFANAGHLAWIDNNPKFIDTLTEFYRLS